VAAKAAELAEAAGGRPVHPVSAVAGRGLQPVLGRVWELVRERRQLEAEARRATAARSRWRRREPPPDAGAVAEPSARAGSSSRSAARSSPTRTAGCARRGSTAWQPTSPGCGPAASRRSW
jgi:hypothetical protein